MLIGSATNLECFIASRPEEVEASQRLRYRVYCEELHAAPSPEIVRAKRDSDPFDEVCDHLLVADRKPDGPSKIVGTYRLLRRDGMKRIGRFYTEAEFDISPILRHPGEILEVGRSCIDPDYRQGAAMQLLWRGLASYINQFKIKLLFGCGSLSGADPTPHARALSYLFHYHLAPPELRPIALSNRFVEMDQQSKERIDAKRAFASLPTLLKGYLRLGAFIGLGAVSDPLYNTLDLAVVLEMDAVAQKYLNRYGN